MRRTGGVIREGERTIENEKSDGGGSSSLRVLKNEKEFKMMLRTATKHFRDFGRFSLSESTLKADWGPPGEKKFPDGILVTGLSKEKLHRKSFAVQEILPS